MYHFLTAKKDEYLEGRKISYVADKVGIAREFLTSILNGKRNCSKITAYCIVKVLYPNNEVDDFFINTKKNK